jgi:hypothetical protein
MAELDAIDRLLQASDKPAVDQLLNEDGVAPTEEDAISRMLSETAEEYDPTKAGAVPATYDAPWLPETNSYGTEFGRILGSAAEGLMNAPAEILQDFGATDNKLYDVDFVDDPESKVGKFSSAILQFMVPFGGAMKGAKALSWGAKLARGSKLEKGALAAGVGGATGAMVFKSDDPNMANLLKELPPEMQGTITDAIIKTLATDADDPAVLNRLRTFVTDSLGGAAADIILNGVIRTTKYAGKVTKDGIVKAAEKSPTWLTDNVKKYGRRPIEHFVQKTADRNLGWKHVSERDKIIRGVDDDIRNLDVYEEARMAHTIGIHEEYLLTKGTFTFSKGGQSRILTGPANQSINDIFTRVQNLGPTAGIEFDKLVKYTAARDLDNYYARRAVALRSAGKGSRALKFEKRSSGIRKTEWQDGLRELQQSPNYRGLMQELEGLGQFNKRFLKMQKEMGVYTQKDIDTFNGIGKIHGFFFRRADEGKEFVLRKDGVTSTMSDAPHSQRKFLDEADLDFLEQHNPLDNMMINLVEGYSNQVKYGLYNRVKQMGYKRIQAMGGAGTDFATDVTQRFKANPRHFKGKNVDTVYMDGKKRYFEVHDPALLETIRADMPISVSPFGQLMLNMGRPFKTLATRSITLNPTFILMANLPRDILSTMILTRGSSGMIGNAKYLAGGFKETALKPLARRMPLIGRRIGSDEFTRAREQGLDFTHRPHDPLPRHEAVKEKTMFSMRRDADQRLRKMGLGKDADNLLVVHPDTMGVALRKIEDMASRFEYAPRMAEYRRLVGMGYSERKAAFIVRDLTDFSNTGSSQYLRMLSSTIPFVNTHIQGVNRFMRAMGGKKLLGKKLTNQEAGEVQRVYHRVGQLSLVYLGLHAYHELSGEILGDPSIRETYRRIKDEIGYDHTIFVMPKDKDGKNTIITIPQPFEFAMPMNATVAAVKDMFSDEEQSFLWNYLSREMLNMGRANDLSMVPQVLRAGVEAYGTGKKFSGQPVETRAEQGMLAEDRYRPHTMNLAIAMGKTFGISPLKVEHIIKNIIPGLVSQFIVEADRVVGETFLDRNEGAAKKTGETYWTRRWFVPSPLRGTRQADLLFEAMDKAGEVEKSIAAMSDRTDEQAQKRLQELTTDPEYTELWQAAPILKARLEGLRALYKQKRRVGFSDMSPEDKAADMDSLDSQINDINNEIADVYIEYSARVRTERKERDE